MRSILTWFLFAGLVAGGLSYINGAIFHALAADVPPGFYPEIRDAVSEWRLVISIGLLLLSGLTIWLLRRRKK